MVWNISLVSLDQLSWLCSLSTSFPPPTYSLEGSRVRNIEGLDTGQTWMSNSQDTGVLEALNNIKQLPPAQETAILQDIWWSGPEDKPCWAGLYPLG